MSEMLELGTLLREERERQGLSIEELSERIKLAPRTLAFIESGTKSELPHPVYVKGFVKSYAMVLGLNPEELGAIVDVAYKDELEEEVAEPVISRRERRGFPVKLIAIVVLIVGLSAAGYYYMQFGTATIGNEATTVEVPVQPPVEQPQPVQSAPERSQAVEPAPGSEAPAIQENEVTAEEVQPGASSTVEVVTEPTVVTEQAPSKALATPVVAPSDVAVQNVVEEEKKQEAKPEEKKAEVAMRALRIEASADCWVEATGEDFGRKEFLLRNGQGYTVNFPKNLSLRLGNSGGISLTLDGVPYSFNGADGKVRTVHIAAS